MSSLFDDEVDVLGRASSDESSDSGDDPFEEEADAVAHEDEQQPSLLATRRRQDADAERQNATREVQELKLRREQIIRHTADARRRKQEHNNRTFINLFKRNKTEQPLLEPEVQKKRKRTQAQRDADNETFVRMMKRISQRRVSPQ